MDTFIVLSEAGKDFNRSGEPVISCSTGCGQKTTMTGTKLCDACWEANRKQESRVQWESRGWRAGR